MAEKKDILYSYYRIRKIIGLLGIFLPFIIFYSFGDLLASISHFYYTKASLFFTAILSAFGILLISYKGYEKDKGVEWLSDNQITFIGGVAAILVVLIPTTCDGSNNELVAQICINGDYPLYGHDNALFRTIHLFSAGIFLFTMGYMSIFRFTKGPDNEEERERKIRTRNNIVYRITGYLVWASIAILLLEFVFHFHFTPYDVFIFECVAVMAFGISWLIKGKAIKDLIDVRDRITKGRSPKGEIQK